jgi:hypothetical protein
MLLDPGTETVPAALDAWWSQADTPGPAFILAVGGKAHRDGWATRAAVALATGWARRGDRITLADLGLDSPELHSELREENTEGVADIFQFGASFQSMTRPVPGRGFHFLPAGEYLPNPAAILGAPGWEHLVGAFDETHSTLLAYLPVEVDGADQLVRRIGRLIVLADPDEVDEVMSRFAGTGTVELVLTPPSSAAGTGAAGPEDNEAEAAEALVALASALRPRTEPESRAEPPLEEGVSLTEPPLLPRVVRRRRKKVSPLLVVLLLVVSAFGGWTILWDRGILPDWAALPGWLNLSDRSLPTPATTTEAESEPVVDEVVQAPVVEAEPVESPLPFSVAVEAHQDYATALERVEALKRSDPRSTFYLTPIPNQGVVYYRLLAGPVADTSAAWSLMRRLVESRHKTDLDPWSIRPTVWAYHLGDFETESAAAARAEELLELRVPTYQVEVEYTAGPPRYRLYAGAYEGPGPAEIMAQILREAGLDAPFVRRQGRPIS